MLPKDDRQNLAPSSVSTASTEPTEISPAPDSTAPTMPASPSLDSTVLPRPERLIGETLDGRYFIEKELGHGGVGVVYLALDRRLLDKCVVVKVLLERWLQDEWIVGKFLHEKEALARIDHPGIIGILDAGELPDGKPYIVMQCVDGVTLRSVMQPEGMEIERTARLIEQAADALGAAHEKGILHRDLKPENIMVQPLGGDREQVKIIDFGIAKVRDSRVAPSTAINAAVGTIAYMSPEQLSARKLTPASDIYTLGAIAYEMLTGRRPFNPESKFEMLDVQRAGLRVKPQDLRPALPERAQAVILKALAFEPSDRFQNAREFGRELAEALAGDARRAKVPDEDAAAKIPAGDGSNSKSLEPGFKLRVILTLALFIVGITGIVFWWASRPAINRQNQPQEKASTIPMPERSLAYSLLVQKMRDGKPYQEPFESSGQEIFENGYKFIFKVSSSEPGYFYLLNESPPDSGAPALTMLYPTPRKNGGSALVEADAQTETGWNVFGGQAGTELLWVVSATERVPELEAAKEIAFKNERGALTDDSEARSVREFLTKHASQRPEVVKDTTRRQTIVKGAGGVLVYLVELEHR
ncbi:MAG: eukaryotic-like serine/threonine-protein kinase [Acidobacteriota bacterium]|nr:eukaryotic-like serine/threonine-protein kinase [Acidobacteriota bacterium]